ncbi:MAG: beta-ketoacyl-[acyl-carrier-protein] synthase family protein [Candidatus Amulumruptor caecigallinarius]|nr:beta-ketoacyl-[acyl-carrier-protein] synthase family protein [Candidatus Amulumruptor caecigallinarius]MCM1396351.1 beta-ketoacyl-[acyl-carrier-protein] synthase family protein [Candidatus Amulumruptor caecigallinarius]MCM1453707.1 beta-ketoacyl-[acyl-carrier-protein] synthase family protein [bacterium]
MTDSPQVFVTGAGIISALGNTLPATLRALLRGECGIAPVRYLSTSHSDLPVGEVKASNRELARMLGVGYPAAELRTVLLGIAAASEAVASASLSDDDLRRIPFINGTTVGGMDLTESCFADLLASEGQSPVAEALRYNACGETSTLIADHVGPFKLVTTTSTACSSAANAIILGANMIKTGMADIVVAGGAEALTKFHLNGFNSLMILDSKRCRPFSSDRAGINLGEGAAYLVLESEDSAKRRGRTPLARLSGYANACDAHHQTATSPNAEGAFRAMTAALAMARLRPSDISYINAHGTGTPDNDAAELIAMQRLWGANLPPFSSTKSLTGHTTSASGAIESVICLLALNHAFIPAPIAQASGVKDTPTNGRPQAADLHPQLCETSDAANLRHLLNNSFGFGGNDTSLIFSRP